MDIYSSSINYYDTPANLDSRLLHQEDSRYSHQEEPSAAFYGESDLQPLPDLEKIRYTCYYPEDTNDFSFVEESLPKRVALVALPFFSLYDPLKVPILLGRGFCRILSKGTNFLGAMDAKDYKKIAYQFLQTTLAVAAFGINFLGSPIGLMIMTGQDFLIESINLVGYLKNRNYTAALESLAKMVNNTLYFGALLSMGIEVILASLCMQTLLSLYRSRKEFTREHYLEAVGFLLLSFLRAYQLTLQVQTTNFALSLFSVEKEEEKNTSN